MFAFQRDHIVPYLPPWPAKRRSVGRRADHHCAGARFPRWKANGCTRTDPPTITLESRSPAPRPPRSRELSLRETAAARSTAADLARRTRAPQRPRSLPGESDAAGPLRRSAAALLRRSPSAAARRRDRGAGAPGRRDHWRRHQPSVLRRGWTKRAHRPQPSNALKREHFGSLSLAVT